MNISKIIKEEIILILESVYNIEEDVDYLYNQFFKNIVDEINNDNYNPEIKHRMLNTSILQSDLLKRAHKKNPAIIEINNENYDNSYSYRTKKIYLSINFSALNFIKSHGNMENALKNSHTKQLKNEFKEHRIKGSIRHELIHYLDDTFTNFFNKSKIFNDIDKMKKFRKNNYIYNQKFEINSIIGNILEIKRTKTQNEWNVMTFDDLMESTPSLNLIMNTLINRGEYEEWRKMVKKRMARENILGNRMK